MKAQRRHELQRNDLAAGVSDLPTMLRLHANKILIGVIIVCLIVLLVRYRRNAAAQASLTARTSLASAHQGLGRLRLIQQSQAGDELGRIKQIRDTAAEVNATVDQVLETANGTDDEVVKAEALVVRGDLNWALANLEPMPGATTRPELSLPNPPTAYLDSAEAAYRQVINTSPTQTFSKATALLGLAAIAENRSNWKSAADNYDLVTSDSTIADSFKAVARTRLAVLPQIQGPIFLGSFSSTQPATAPASEPTTLQATQPSTTTAPTTGP